MRSRTRQVAQPPPAPPSLVPDGCPGEPFPEAVLFLRSKLPPEGDRFLRMSPSERAAIQKRLGTGVESLRDLVIDLFGQLLRMMGTDYTTVEDGENFTCTTLDEMVQCTNADRRVCEALAAVTYFHALTWDRYINIYDFRHLLGGAQA